MRSTNIEFPCNNDDSTDVLLLHRSLHNNNNRHTQQQFSYVGTLDTFHSNCNYEYNRKYNLSNIPGITQILVHKEWPHSVNHVLSFTHFPLHVFSNLYFYQCSIFKICSKVFLFELFSSCLQTSFLINYSILQLAFQSVTFFICHVIIKHDRESFLIKKSNQIAYK